MGQHKDRRPKIWTVIFLCGERYRGRLYQSIFRQPLFFDSYNEVITHLQQLLSSSNDKTNMETDLGAKALTHFLSMLSSGTIHSSVFLFWNLPESFLHPSWQVTISRLLVMCASSGIRICLSAQSLYIVQAVRYDFGIIH